MDEKISSGGGTTGLTLRIDLDVCAKDSAHIRSIHCRDQQSRRQWRQRAPLGTDSRMRRHRNRLQRTLVTAAESHEEQ
eukprot:SAG31_NODE_313_length_17858_cov_34.811307_14_plen_78_part_00